MLIAGSPTAYRLDANLVRPGSRPHQREGYLATQRCVVIIISCAKLKTIDDEVTADIDKQQVLGPRADTRAWVACRATFRELLAYKKEISTTQHRFDASIRIPVVCNVQDYRIGVRRVHYALIWSASTNSTITDR